MSDRRLPSSLTMLADEPLTDPKDDLLGRAEFAEAVAKSIIKMPAESSFVVALYGSWGTGKSTTINFILHYLKKCDEEQQVIVVRFNPWWFSGSEYLLRAFFNQLVSALERKGGPAQAAKQVARKVQRYGNVVGPFLSLIPYIGSAAKEVVETLLSTEEDLQTARDEAEEELRRLGQQGQKILVVMDDIDRLTANEIRQIFQLVKSVANFPATLYLLGFDQEVVVKALEDIQCPSGQDYLDKIVQAPFHLPPPDEHMLRQLLYKYLEQILGDPKTIVDPVRWQNVFTKGIIPFINTPRDVKRYINMLIVTWPAVRGEVDAVDFLGIEALRLFVPKLYATVRDNKELFAGPSADSPFQDMNADERKRRYEQLLKEIDEELKGTTYNLLTYLFPKFATAFGGPAYDSNWERRWRRQKLVCSRDVFDTYFKYSVPEGVISAAEMDTILQSGSDSRVFADHLRRLAKQRGRTGHVSRAGVFLERMEDYTERDIPVEDIPGILQGLYDAGDELVRLRDFGGLWNRSDNNIRIGRLAYQLLQRITSEDERFEILNTVFTNTTSTYCVASMVSLLEEEWAKPLMTNEKYLGDLRSVALGKIEKAASDDSLRALPEVRGLLAWWRSWAGEDPVKQYVAHWISSDEGLASFITDTATVRRGQAWGDTVSRVYLAPDPEFIGGLVENITDVRQRVERLLARSPEWLSEYQRQALEAFVSNKGESPDT